VQNILKIQELINSYLGVSDVEKTALGEVFTPFWLINKKLDLYDKDDFRNPNLKWIFPSGGIGNYQYCVIERLMNGLKEWEPDAEKRYKHIIENQIYTCEIQSKNIFIFLMLFNLENKYKMNYYKGSFIDDGFDKHMKEVWKIDNFDRSPENPPYNAPQKAKGKKGGGDLIWDDFVVKTIKILKDNGRMTFVHPAAWRKPESDKSKNKGLYKFITDNQIHYLEIHNSVDGKKTFNANTRYDFYLLEKTKPYKDTMVVDEDGKENTINLKDWKFLPNGNYDLIKPLLAENGEETCPIIFNRTNYGTDKDWVVEEKNDKYKYELIHSTPKAGTRYMYSSRNDKGHFGIPKVIFGESGVYDVIIDMDGKYGMTQCAMAIPVESYEEAEKIKNVLLSDEFNKIIKSTSFGNFRIDWRMFTYFKKDWWKEIK
jgi:hypothetical protein